jgi:cob(I)alamin adenosyltransferase
MLLPASLEFAADSQYTLPRGEGHGMGNRLTKIYTRTGDDGTTGLGDGSRTTKDSARIEALGAVDELNSAIGVVLTEELPPELREPLLRIQNELFDLGGELCIPGHALVREAQITRLEQLIDKSNVTLPPLREFILPGGSRAASLCHAARTLCRSAERRVIGLSRSEPVSPLAIKYLNRLSDLLFVMARICNRHSGVPEVLWQPGGNGPRTR